MGRICGANLAPVANDEVAEDSVQQNPMEMVRQKGLLYVSGRCKSHRQHSSRRRSQKILLVCKTRPISWTLVKGGVPVNRMNVGKMDYANGKQQDRQTVSVDAVISQHLTT
ncbi:PTS sugar transporter subunit IIB [Shigella flexneri]